MAKPQLTITFLTVLVLLILGSVQAGDSYRSHNKNVRNEVTIEAGMNLQDIARQGLRVAMFVGHSGNQYFSSYEVSAIAISSILDPSSEIEKAIFRFSNDGFGRTVNDLYVAFVGDPYLRLFQLEKPVGARSYDRILRIGNAVEISPMAGAPFKIGRSLNEKYMVRTFVQNPALDRSSDYDLGETKRGGVVIPIYTPKYKATNIDCWYKSSSNNLFGSRHRRINYEPSAPPLASYEPSAPPLASYEPSAPPLASYEPSVPTIPASSDSWYPSWGKAIAPVPKIKYQQSLKNLYSEGLQVSLVFAPTDEAASWMPGEPFTLTAFAAGADYYTTKQVLAHIDGISGFVPGIRFITIKGDLQGRLFQIQKYNGEWVIDRVEDKSTSGAPFELVGRLRQGDPQHPYFAYDEIKFVPWYTAEKGVTYAAYVGSKVVPVSYAKGMFYTAAEKLFKKSL